MGFREGGPCEVPSVSRKFCMENCVQLCSMMTSLEASNMSFTSWHTPAVMDVSSILPSMYNG